MQSARRFYIYILTNGPLAVILYVGTTGDLRRRVWQYKNKPVGFTARYNLTRLIYFECFIYPDAAIRRVLTENRVSNYELTVRSRSGDLTVVR